MTAIYDSKTEAKIRKEVFIADRLFSHFQKTFEVLNGFSISKGPIKGRGANWDLANGLLRTYHIQDIYYFKHTLPNLAVSVQSKPSVLPYKTKNAIKQPFSPVLEERYRKNDFSPIELELLSLDKVQEEIKEALSKKEYAKAQKKLANERKQAILRAKQIRESEERKRAKEEYQRKVDEYSVRMKLALPQRMFLPKTIALHLGPTNSGKTYDAINFLAQQGKGTYAAPLRMLAHEVFEKLSSLKGAEKVGLITGEEQINPTADILCTTTEMAPIEGDTLVLDEIQWITDPERGWYWLKLILGASYKHIRICGSSQMQFMLDQAFANCKDVISYNHPRLADLEYHGNLSLKQIPSRTIVVAFSKKAVMSLAKALLEEKKAGVSVLYGALPPESRKEQIRKFISGENEYIVTTDVIGHGINLPADNIVITQTEKFDGTSFRNLHLWEIAQIIGRAGRFGLSPKGNVYTLQGRAGFTPSTNLIKKGVEVAKGIRSEPVLNNSKAILQPTMSVLGSPDKSELQFALQVWLLEAKEIKNQYPWIQVANITECIERIKDIQRTAPDISLEDLWTLARAPIDTDKGISISTFASAIMGKFSMKKYLLTQQQINNINLDNAEISCVYARDLRWFSLAYPLHCDIPMEKLAWMEVELAKRISILLPKTIKKNTFGRCQECGDQCAPWFIKCEECFRSRNYYRDDYWDDDDDDEDDDY